MSFTINMDLLNKAREDNGMTVDPIGEQINYIAPDPVEDELDIFADTTAPAADFSIGTLAPTYQMDVPGLTDTTSFGNDLINFNMADDPQIKAYVADPQAYLKEQERKAAEAAAAKAADTRPSYIKDAPTTYEEHQAALKWRIENEKMTKSKRTELIHRLNGGGMEADKQLWDITQRLNNMTSVEKAQNPQLVQDLQVAKTQLTNALIKSASAAGKSDAIKYGVPLTMLAGDIASGGMLSAAKNVTTGAVEGDLGKVAEGVLGAGLTLTAKDIKSVTEAAEAAAVAGDWAKAAELSREAEQLKNIKSGIGTASALASGNIGTALLTGAPLIGVDPVGSVTEMVFGQDATFDDSFAFDNNYKFGGGFDVSAASEGIVQAGGKLLDTGGDIEEALKTGLMTYAREGGSLPDLNLDGGGLFDINLPDINLPDIEVPRINLGDIYDDIDFPDLPDINLPDISVPDIDLPSIEVPRINLGDVYDDIDFPDLPDINVPDLDLPDINVPDINVPDINIPDFEVDLNAPEFNMELPEFESPEFSSLDVDIDLPDLPSLKLSEGKKKQLEELPETAKIKVANILTDATFLQLTPLQQRDYLDELLRSMQT